MIAAPICVLHTHDPELVRRVRAFVRTMAQLRHVAEAERVGPVLEQSGSAVLIVDLRTRESRRLLEEIEALREETAAARLPAPPERESIHDRYGVPSLPLLRFPRVFRRFDTVDALLSSVVENLA